MEDDQKKGEGVPRTTKSPPQLIKQQKGFIKHALTRPSPSGKSKTPSRPGSSASQHKREGSPSVLTTAAGQKVPSPSRPTSRLFAKALLDTTRPSTAAPPAPAGAEQRWDDPPPAAKPKPEPEKHDDNGKRKSPPRNITKSPKRSKKDNDIDDNGRYDGGGAVVDQSRSPSPRSPTANCSGRNSVEEGEVRDQQKEEKYRDRGRDRGGDKYRKRSRSRSRDRSRHLRRRDGDSRKGSGRDRYEREYSYDDERGYGGRRRGRSSSYDRRKRSRSRSRSKDRRRHRHRDDRSRDRGGRSGYDYKERGDTRDRGKSRSPSREKQERSKPYGGRDAHARGGAATGAGAAPLEQQQQASYYQQQRQPVPMISVYQQQQPNYNAYHQHHLPPPPHQYQPQHPQDVAPPPPPPRRAPPSPDVSKYLATMSTAHNIEWSPTSGLAHPQLLLDKINNAEKMFRNKECHVWAAQQAQQERLLAILDGDVPDPFDEVLERLGLLQPQQHFSPGSPLKIKKTPLASVSEIPFEPLNPSAPPPDPRNQFPEEYKAVKEWARRPLRVPLVRAKQPVAGGDGTTAPARPTVSWSHSPSRDYGEPEVTTTKNREKPQRSQPPSGFGTGSRRPSSSTLNDDVLNAPSAPRHDMSFPRSVPGSTHRPGSAAAVAAAAEKESSLAAMPPMSLDEGYFELTFPDGTVVEKLTQYSELLQLVSEEKPVPRGKVPSGWPVYRSKDGLWAPLRKTLTSIDEFDCTRVKEAVSYGEGNKLWDQNTQNRSHEWWIAKEKETAKEVAAAAGGAEKILKPEGQFAVSGEKRVSDVATQLLKKESAPGLLDKVYTGAARAVAEAEAKLKLTKGPSLPVSTYAAPEHAISAVHGALLANRDKIQIVAKSVLQSALRTVIEQQQQVAKKKLAEKAQTR